MKLTWRAHCTFGLTGNENTRVLLDNEGHGVKGERSQQVG